MNKMIAAVLMLCASVSFAGFGGGRSFGGGGRSFGGSSFSGRSSYSGSGFGGYRASGSAATISRPSYSGSAPHIYSSPVVVHHYDNGGSSFMHNWMMWHLIFSHNNSGPVVSSGSGSYADSSAATFALVIVVIAVLAVIAMFAMGLI